jgi:hypothetical protein
MTLTAVMFGFFITTTCVVCDLMGPALPAKKPFSARASGP